MFKDIALNLPAGLYFLSHFYSLMRIKDVFDILIVAVVIYFILIFIKQSRSYIIFYSVLVFTVIAYLSRTLDLGLTRQMFQTLTTFFVFIFIVIFQKELRKFFDWILISGRKLTQAQRMSLSTGSSFSIVKAIEELAKKKIGALIVLPGEYPLEGLVEGGFALDGRISVPLLLSIFDDSSPGHDGAVIIDNNRIRKFGVHLPLAENYTAFAKAGTRHRAGVGITEKSDSLAIIVSEERGEISLAENGKLELVKEMPILQDRIRTFIKENTTPVTGGHFWQSFLSKDLSLKLGALVVAFFCWYFLIYQSGIVNKDIVVPVEYRSLPKSLTISNSSPKEVTVTVTGADRDLQDFTQDKIKVFVDLTKATEGLQKIHLEEKNVSYPNYVELIKIAPEITDVEIAKASVVSI